MTARRPKKAAGAASAADVRRALRKRFAAPAWALLEEVRNKTGYGGRSERYADAIAMSLWPSRGLEIHGVEIKARRPDWTRERDDPEKAEAIAKYCDRWWLAVSDESIVKDGELPPAWGLLVLRKDVLVATREAEKTEAAPLDRRFVAAMLRRAAERAQRGVQPEEAEARIAAELARSDADRRSAWERDAQEELVRLRRQLEWVEDFERESGIHLDTWGRWKWGAIGELVQAMKQKSRGGTVDMIARRLEEDAKRLRAELDAVEKAHGVVAGLRANEAP